MRRMIPTCIVAFLATTLLASSASADDAGGQASASEAASGARAQCSLATLHGTYDFAANGVQIGGPDAGPFAYAGLITYDGKGGVTEVYSASFNGAIARRVTESGRYTVNPDCTASETDTGGGSTQHYDSFLQPDGKQFTYVQTDPGVVSAGTAFRTVNRSEGD